MINKVTLIGNLGKDPEVRHLENGAMVASFSLATNENYRDKDGNWQKLTEWHNIVAWRELAERAERSLKKGSLAYIEGKISYRKYTGSDNVERTVTDIVASVIRPLEKIEGAGDSRFPSAEPPSRNYAGGAPSAPAPSGVEAPVVADGGDDLPF